MISIRRLVEQQGMDSQYYDLGKDFSNFRKNIDGAYDQLKQRFESLIGNRLNGKRIRARASRGYKQYVKDYEFDVTKITIDDYYGNYVVVAHDNTTPKAKEYFLKPGFKIQVLGGQTGQPSPQKGGDPKFDPSNNNQNTQIQSAPDVASVGMKENKTDDRKYYDIYSIEDIEKDIQTWVPELLIKVIPKNINDPSSLPNLREFISGLGCMKDIKNGKTIILYNIKLPKSLLKSELSSQKISDLLSSASSNESKYTLKSMTFDDTKDDWNIGIKKITLKK